ncbi:hypothetical protein BS47DRAFT_1019902 [Hydnum rufescens UP504]|uniref:NADH dehydrogenase subunit 4L n=1 Tax=Hydnum rufescens UP504 TaxID=1448309 RepID=A0A9P6AVR8_9AGAM|nr:hypothetical protein BS47DRAFT_1019902 [Hydnum rufescens UP504]
MSLILLLCRLMRCLCCLLGHGIAILPLISKLMVLHMSSCMAVMMMISFPRMQLIFTPSETTNGFIAFLVPMATRTFLSLVLSIRRHTSLPIMDPIPL